MDLEDIFEKIYFKCNLEPLFEHILRETNGQTIPTNAMTDYKKQNVDFEYIRKEIEQKLLKNVVPAKLYNFVDDKTFEKDYNELYGNGKTYKTPLGSAICGNNQYKKLCTKNRAGLLYLIKDVLVDPVVIIWKPVTDDNRKQEKENAIKQQRSEIWLKGKLVFAKIFEFPNKNKAVNSITIQRENMWISISVYDLNVNDFVK